MQIKDKYDFIVIGSGIAGLASALQSSQYGKVLLITKGSVLESNTFFAQGGIAAAIAPGDTPEAHQNDTILAGAELCEVEAVSLLVRQGPARVRELMEMGAKFDRTPEGEIALGQEGAHSKPRILHARGDATGAEISSVLADQVRRREGIEVCDKTFVVDLIVKDNRCIGCWILEEDKTRPVLARGCIMAAGGCGQIFRYTTNPWVATGDGIAMAYRAGALIADMEFIQFHPTALKGEENPLFLISEAVRGEGAVLIDRNGNRFMKDVHPMAELAPRDIVARSIFSVIKKEHDVYLDATSIKESFPNRFPNIFKACKERGINPLTDPIPVTPAAHFAMGGIQTNVFGQTSLAGLYACGEVACSGVHGANRLASNSLLEGIVFAERLAQLIKEEKLPPRLNVQDYPFGESIRLPDEEDKIRNIMWEHSGIIRHKDGLLKLLKQFKELQSMPENAYIAWNMLNTAQLVVKGALVRNESRGGHFRKDYPQTDEYWRLKHVIQQLNKEPRIDSR